jgi:hypothetical protein
MESENNTSKVEKTSNLGCKIWAILLILVIGIIWKPLSQFNYICEEAKPSTYEKAVQKASMVTKDGEEISIEILQLLDGTEEELGPYPCLTCRWFLSSKLIMKEEGNQIETTLKGVEIEINKWCILNEGPVIGRRGYDEYEFVVLLKNECSPKSPTPLSLPEGVTKEEDFFRTWDQYSAGKLKGTSFLVLTGSKSYKWLLSGEGNFVLYRFR